jgi:hypothetical protein
MMKIIDKGEPLAFDTEEVLVLYLSPPIQQEAKILPFPVETLVPESRWAKFKRKLRSWLMLVVAYLPGRKQV